MFMKHGIQVGASAFTDLVYADDTNDASARLSSFTEAAALGFKILWAKTKLHNVGSGPAPNSIPCHRMSIWTHYSA